MNKKFIYFFAGFGVASLIIVAYNKISKDSSKTSK